MHKFESAALPGKPKSLFIILAVLTLLASTLSGSLFLSFSSIAALIVLMQLIIIKLKRKLLFSLGQIKKTNEELCSANEELHTKYNEIHRLAYHNAVSGLPNKNYFKEALEDLIDDKSTTRFALVYFDLDDFKSVNDTYGHGMGDHVLKALAVRMPEKEDSDIFNLGGDEFIFLVKNTDHHSVEIKARELLDCIKAPLPIGRHVFHISASMGIAFFPEHGASFEELLKNADAAMYESKRTEKGSYTFFTKDIGTAVREKTQMQSRLRKALSKDEFLLHYQPQWDEAAQRIWGFEALIRWNSREYGMMPPNAFIGEAEDSGLILPIGEWVLKSACAFICRLNREADSAFIVSVNISALQLLQNGIVESIFKILAATGLEPGLLELEVTESCLLEETAAVIERLEKLKSRGVRIALDDFGTGYSSLGYLRDLPIQTLKIDRSFVSSILQSDKNRSMVDMMISIGHSLGMELVAEGVETEQQRALLAELKCDRIQGYLLCRPLPENDVADYLKSLPS
jgi:diguanylate cyclase (GGDEF)-like protein